MQRDAAASGGDRQVAERDIVRGMGERFIPRAAVEAMLAALFVAALGHGGRSVELQRSLAISTLSHIIAGVLYRITP